MINQRFSQNIRHAVFVISALLLSACSTKKESISVKDSNEQIKHEEIFHLYENISRPFSLNSYQAGEPARKIKQIGNNASGITWDPHQKQYFIIQNNSAILYRFDSEFKYQGKLKKAGKIHQDTEGVSFIDGTKMLIATEANAVYVIEVNQSVYDRGYFSSSLGLRFAGRPPVKNKGIESTAYRVGSGSRKARYYAAVEGTGRSPQSKMRVLYVDADVKSGFFDAFRSYDSNLTVTEPFDAEAAFAGVITDIAGMTFDPFGETLLILSQESRKLIQVHPETGEVLAQLKLSGAPVYEGVTIGPNGELVFVSEKNWVQVYPRKLKTN